MQTSVTVTMLQTCVGEDGTLWDAGSDYTATVAFAREIVALNLATAEFEEPASDGWDDLRFPVQGINPAGAVDAPTIDTVLTSFPGTLLFSGSQENVIAGVAQMPHAWKRGSRIKPHIHWSKPVGSANAVSWVFYYRMIGYAGSAAGAWTGPIAGTVVAGDPSVTDQHLITSFGPIDMTGQRESTCLAWQVRRLGNTDADSGTARLYEFDIHFVADKRGTTYEIPGA